MTYRDSALAPPLSDRPPKLFGFALYLIGTGCAGMGVAQLGVLLTIHGLLGSSYGFVTRWGMAIGELMVFVGLAIAWRTTRPPRRRFVAVATTLWAAMSVIDFDQERVRRALVLESLRGVLAPTAATFAGWAIALGLLAIVVHAGGRAFAARTWATTLGACLVIADAWEQALPVVVPMRSRYGSDTTSYASVIALDVIGLGLVAGGLFAAGRSILRGVTIGEYVRAKSRRPRDDDDVDAGDPWRAALRRGLPLLADAGVAIAGLATALATVIALARSLRTTPRALTESAVAGGQLVAMVLLALALHRLGGFGQRAARFAYGALGSLVLVVLLIVVARTRPGTELGDVVPFLGVAPPVLAAGALYASSTALGAYEAGGATMSSLRAHLRAMGVLLGLSAVGAFLATQLAETELRQVFDIASALAAALALTFAIRGANDARRIEVALAHVTSSPNAS